jgi:ethanolamine utilization protein EutN
LPLTPALRTCAGCDPTGKAKHVDIVTVIGTVVCTRKEEKLRGGKLLLVAESADSPAGDAIVALDTVGAGVGERVMIVRGSSARAAANLSETPVDAAIVGIIDQIEKDGETIFRKYPSDQTAGRS